MLTETFQDSSEGRKAKDFYATSLHTSETFQCLPRSLPSTYYFLALQVSSYMGFTRNPDNNRTYCLPLVRTIIFYLVFMCIFSIAFMPDFSSFTWIWILRRHPFLKILPQTAILLSLSELMDAWYDVTSSFNHTAVQAILLIKIDEEQMI